MLVLMLEFVPVPVPVPVLVLCLCKRTFRTRIPDSLHYSESWNAQEKRIVETYVMRSPIRGSVKMKCKRRTFQSSWQLQFAKVRTKIPRKSREMSTLWGGEVRLRHLRSFDYNYQNALRQAIVFRIFSFVKNRSCVTQDCTGEMHSGSCSQMASSCQYPMGWGVKVWSGGIATLRKLVKLLSLLERNVPRF